MSSTVDVLLNNAPTGEGGIIQVAPDVGQNLNTATLAITNTIDYSSATVLRDSATSSLYGTLSLSKAGPGVQTWDISILASDGSIALVAIPEPCRPLLLALSISLF